MLATLLLMMLTWLCAGVLHTERMLSRGYWSPWRALPVLAVKWPVIAAHMLLWCCLRGLPGPTRRLALLHVYMLSASYAASCVTMMLGWLDTMCKTDVADYNMLLDRHNAGPRVSLVCCWARAMSERLVSYCVHQESLLMLSIFDIVHTGFALTVSANDKCMITKGRWLQRWCDGLATLKVILLMMLTWLCVSLHVHGHGHVLPVQKSTAG